MLFNAAAQAVKEIIGEKFTYQLTYEMMDTNDGRIPQIQCCIAVFWKDAKFFRGQTWTECMNKLRIHLEPAGVPEKDEAPEESAPSGAAKGEG
jgi:hypothetical protein